MDLLKSLAMPQPVEHYRLLLFMLNLTFIVFVPYIGFLLGGAILAWREERKGRSTGNAMKVRFARDLVDIVLASKKVLAFMGVIPSLVLVFLYAQLLQQTPAIAVELAAWGFLLLLTAGILLYAYKYTFDLAGVLDGLLGKGHVTDEAKQFAAVNMRTHEAMGRWGIVSVAAGLFLLTSAIAVATDPALWEGIGAIWELFITPSVYVKYLQFLALSLGVTGLGIVFFLFGWEGGRKLEPEYAAYARKKGIDLAVVSLLAQPLLILLSLLMVPAEALSGVMVALAGIAVVMLLLALQLLYAMEKEGKLQYAALAFFSLICASAFTVTKDQLGIQNATKDHAARLVVSHERQIDALKAQLGIGAPLPTGEDIYNGKCAACHLYDQKKVGPPYNAVIPKYSGKKADMIAFVLNPVKVDPAYPPMPNQGLKPTEADSIVSYLFRKYGQQ
jgi:cytochrome c